MPDPTQVVTSASDTNVVAEGTVGAIAALGVLARLVQIVLDWWGKRTTAKLTADVAAEELRVKEKSEENTSSHRAAELSLSLAERQAKEVERAEARAITAEGKAEAAEKELATCEEKHDHLLGRMTRFEREHAGCPGAAAFATFQGQYASLSAKYDIMAEQNEWMERVITAHTGVTPPRKTMPAPTEVAVEAAKQRDKRTE